MTRLFIGLRPPAEIRRLLSGLGGTLPGARPVPEDQVHLTVRFIGEVEGSLVKDIQEALPGLSHPPLTLSISGTGHFPPRGRPRVLWAGVAPAGEVIILRNKINNLLAHCGIEPEQRKFHPHVTIARLGNSPAGRVAHFLAGNALLSSPPFVIDRVHLFSSVLSPKGAVHRIEGQYRLQAPRPTWTE